MSLETEAAWSNVRTLTLTNLTKLGILSQMYMCTRTDVYVHGGYNGEEAFADLWRLDLRVWEWQQLPCKSPVPLYFHSAAVTEVCYLHITVLLNSSLFEEDPSLKFFLQFLMVSGQ